MKFTSFAYNIMFLDMLMTGKTWKEVRFTASHQKDVLNNPDSFVTKNVVYILSDRNLRLCWDKKNHELGCPRLVWSDPNEAEAIWAKAVGLRECISYIINTTL